MTRRLGIQSPGDSKCVLAPALGGMSTSTTITTEAKDINTESNRRAKGRERRCCIQLCEKSKQLSVDRQEKSEFIFWWGGHTQ